MIKCASDSEKVVYKREEFWNFVIDIDQKVEKMFIESLSEEFPDHK